MLAVGDDSAERVKEAENEETALWLMTLVMLVVVVGDTVEDSEGLALGVERLEVVDTADADAEDVDTSDEVGIAVAELLVVPDAENVTDCDTEPESVTETVGDEEAEGLVVAVVVPVED